MLKKLLKDPYYSQVYKAYNSLDKVIEAGFFDDKINKLDYKLDLLCTPWHKIKKPETNKTVVLLTTGSFSPIHKGHMQMMNLAKKTLEKKGYEVLGGYISLSHDDYVKQKYEGKAYIPGGIRLNICEKVVQSSSWLMVDPWELYYTPGPVNFTDVILRLKQYLLKHLKLETEIAYVFGSDNTAFLRTFLKEGIGVCVQRDGSSYEEILKEKHLQDPKRILFIPCKNNKASSSKVRAGDLTYFFEKVSLRSSNKEEYNYFFRDDFKISSPEHIKKSREESFKKNILKAFKDSFKNSSKFEENLIMNTLTLDLKKQKTLIETIKDKTISLDLYFKGNFPIEISREFNFADGQITPNRLVSRNKESIEEQIKKIPAGEYTLIEDDKASGRTLALFYSLLSSKIKVKKEFILTQEQGIQGFYDIVDFRDFLIGSKNGGLNSVLPNNLPCKIPYVLPYVSLKSRAKIHASQEKKMSIFIWKENLKVYKNSKIKVKDLQEDIKSLFLYIGFTKNTLLKDVILWHIKQLKN